MRTAYTPLSASLLQRGTGFCGPTQALPEQVGLEDPALDVMTDLTRVSAVVIRPIDSVAEAHQRMIQRGVRLLLVLDHDRQIAQRGCKRGEILVSDIMTPQGRLEVLDMDGVRSARVGHIVATLKASGRQHAMAVERGPHGRATLRGLFSATRIARQLGVAIQTAEVGRTFSEIKSLLVS
ncbi:MAG: CBS domain-containing protein [Betaproteobacteria bacterium]|nr:CBS domain-containing protein [Betaproteobacteria bacterium]